MNCKSSTSEQWFNQMYQSKNEALEADVKSNQSGTLFLGISKKPFYLGRLLVILSQICTHRDWLLGLPKSKLTAILQNTCIHS